MIDDVIGGRRLLIEKIHEKVHVFVLSCKIINLVPIFTSHYIIINGSGPIKPQLICLQFK